MKVKTIAERANDTEYLNKFIATVEVIDIKPFYVDVDCGYICYMVMYEEFKSL